MRAATKGQRSQHRCVKALIANIIGYQQPSVEANVADMAVRNYSSEKFEAYLAAPQALSLPTRHPLRCRRHDPGDPGGPGSARRCWWSWRASVRRWTARRRRASPLRRWPADGPERASTRGRPAGRAPVPTIPPHRPGSRTGAVPSQARQRLGFPGRRPGSCRPAGAGVQGRAAAPGGTTRTRPEGGRHAGGAKRRLYDGVDARRGLNLRRGSACFAVAWPP